MHGVTSVTEGVRKSLFVIDDTNGLGEGGVVKLTPDHIDSFLTEVSSGSDIDSSSSSSSSGEDDSSDGDSSPGAERKKMTKRIQVLHLHLKRKERLMTMNKVQRMIVPMEVLIKRKEKTHSIK